MGAADPRDRNSGGHAPLDEAYMRQYPKLEIISSFGVGYDNIDAKAAARLGITVTNTPGVLDDEVADTTLGLMIMTVRQLPQSERYLREAMDGEGRFSAQSFAEGPHRRHSGTRAHRQGDRDPREGLRARCRLSRTARPGRCPLSLLFFAHRHGQGFGRPDRGRARRPRDAAYHRRRGLKALGPDGVLINVARGSLVDEKALIEALRNKTILAAGLDVFENEPSVPQELMALENTVLLPHVGSASVKTRRAMAVAWFQTCLPGPTASRH